MFQLSKSERDELVTICDRFKTLKHSSVNPYAFTEQGVAMLSSVLNSETAIQVNIAIMRTFVKLREILSTNKEFAYKLVELEHRMASHDKEIKTIFMTIRQLMTPKENSKRKLGFLTE